MRIQLFSRRTPYFLRRLRGWALTGFGNVSVGRHCVLENAAISSGCTLEDHVRILGSPKVTLGRDVYVNCYTMMLGDILIEQNVLISQFVTIWGRSHRYIDRARLIWDQHGRHGFTDQGYDVSPIIIRKGAWIAPHVTVLRGVTIGEGAVVGANSVVTRSIPDFAIAYGAPATVRKYRE